MFFRLCLKLPTLYIRGVQEGGTREQGAVAPFQPLTPPGCTSTLTSRTRAQSKILDPFKPVQIDRQTEINFLEGTDQSNKKRLQCRLRYIFLPLLFLFIFQLFYARSGLSEISKLYTLNFGSVYTYVHPNGQSLFTSV